MIKNTLATLNLELVEKAQKLAKEKGNFDDNIYVEQLIKLNQPLIVDCMKKNVGIVNQIKSYDVDDVFQYLTLELYKAIKYFDYTKGYKFSSFAMTCFKKCLLNLLKKENVLKRKDLNNTISLDENIANNESETFSLIDIIADPNSNHIFENLHDKLEWSNIFKKLNYFFDKKDLYILKLVYSKNETFENLSKMLNTSKQNLHKQIHQLYKKIRTCYELSNFTSTQVDNQNFNYRKMKLWAIGRYVFKNDVNIKILFNYLPSDEIFNCYKKFMLKIFKTNQISDKMQNKLYDYAFTPQEAQFLQFRYFDKLSVEQCKKVFGENNFNKIEKIVLEKLENLCERIKNNSLDLSFPLKYTTNASKNIIKFDYLKNQKYISPNLFELCHFMNFFVNFPYYQKFLSQEEISFINKFKNKNLDTESISIEQNYEKILNNYRKYKTISSLIQMGLNKSDIKQIVSNKTANTFSLQNREFEIASFTPLQNILVYNPHIKEIKKFYHARTLQDAYKIDEYYLQKVPLLKVMNEEKE